MNKKQDFWLKHTHVTIREDLESGQRYGKNSYVHNMLSGNTIMEVLSNNISEGQYFHNDFNYTPEMTIEWKHFEQKDSIIDLMELK